MLKKNLFTLTLAMLLCSASQLFSQGKWVPSTWPPDSLNIEQTRIKPLIEKLFNAGWDLAQKISIAQTVGKRTLSVDGNDTMWRKTIVTDCGITFESGANVLHNEPFWLSIEVDGVFIQWTPQNRFGQVWTNWNAHTNEPNWAFVLNGYEMTWQAEENGQGQFTEADFERVQNAIATITACVAPYQSSRRDSVMNAIAWMDSMIAKADSIPDYSSLEYAWLMVRYRSPEDTNVTRWVDGDLSWKTFSENQDTFWKADWSAKYQHVTFVRVSGKEQVAVLRIDSLGEIIYLDGIEEDSEDFAYEVIWHVFPEIQTLEQTPVLDADLDKLFSITITFESNVTQDTIIDGWNIRLVEPQGTPEWVWEFEKNDSSYYFNQALKCVSARCGFTVFTQKMEQVKLDNGIVTFIVVQSMLPDSKEILCLETPPVNVERTGWVKD